MSGAGLADSWGRVATDLRVSLTDRCNLRCSYCMPAEGLDWLPGADTLTDDEVVRLIRIGVERLGIAEVRFTGGEPLLRRGLVEIIRQTKLLEPTPAVAMTTNGIGLERVAASLAGAGLDRVNVSLDTLDPVVFKELTRRDRFVDVVRGIDAARVAGLRPVKINAVLMRDVNDGEAPALLAWCLERGVELRFIEQMPLDAQHSWDQSTMVTADEVLATLRRTYELEPLSGRGSAPAQEYSVDGGPATVGVIGSVTQPFCGDCNRVRLTADGQVRNCLFSRTESDLRAALRAGADDDAIAAQWRTTVAGKLPGHGIDDPGFLQPTRPMSAIGG